MWSPVTRPQGRSGNSPGQTGTAIPTSSDADRVAPMPSRDLQRAGDGVNESHAPPAGTRRAANQPRAETPLLACDSPIRNSDPTPTVLVTSSVAPSRVQIDREIAKPSPVPP